MLTPNLIHSNSTPQLATAPLNMPPFHPALQFTYPLPYGAIVHDGGVQFVVFSRHATSMKVLLYNDVADPDPANSISFDRDDHRWGDIWSMFVPGLGPGQLYHFQADGPFDPPAGHRFDGKARLIDPYARALAGEFLPPDEDQVLRPPKCVVVDETFDWQGDRHIRRSLAESIIYELHVKGFTRSDTSQTEHPGTYLGVIEKIPYLKSLGVTAVELMPVHEFPIRETTGELSEKPNYWGYDSLAFFSPHRGYQFDPAPGSQVREFKQMVRALHAEGIEVILDVVFNHTAEGNHLGPTLHFKGLQNNVYYMLEEDGHYRNYSGCGNTVNGNHPVVREMIFHCLRHWVHNYHIDGFRFDLASILARNTRGELQPNPPMVEVIAEDPMLADTKIIAEAWDAAGAYQVGSFADRRWAEWNGRYRDDVRRFWRGDSGLAGALATRLAGSSDLYEKSGRRPYHSINFITSHDGFTLNDLVSYEQKHNWENKEGNHDGDNNNFSCNYGVEGPSKQRTINQLRTRQIKNMLATLMLSQGVPMMLAGDETRRTQLGNNNAYCQDNDLAWFDWDLVEENEELLRFTRALIEFRRSQPTIRRASFLTGRTLHPDELPDVSWYDSSGKPIEWDLSNRSLTCLFGTSGLQDPSARHVMVMVHAGDRNQEFDFPRVATDITWKTFINTAAPPPRDVFPNVSGPIPKTTHLVMAKKSLLCFVSDGAP